MDEDNQTVSQDLRSEKEILLSIEVMLLRVVELLQSRPIVIPNNAFVITCEGQPLDKRIEDQLGIIQHKVQHGVGAWDKWAK